MQNVFKKVVPLLKYKFKIGLQTSTMADTGSKELVNSIVMKSAGSWDQIEVAKWPIPKMCAADEVKVSVNYCGVNFADVYHVQGILAERSPPFVFGLECAGRVIDIGESVKNFKVDDRVACYAPEGGLFQEKVVVPSYRCFSIPPFIPSADATALFANYLTAYFSLFYSANLRPGFSVFIHSVAGGVGWAVTQLAHSIPDVKVYGTCSEHKHTIVKSSGVDVTFTYDNYMDELKKTNTKFDIIIDNIGGDSIGRSLELLNPLGSVVIIGANCIVSDNQEVVNTALQSLAKNPELRELVCGNKSVSGLHLGTLFAQSPQAVHDAVQKLFHLYEEGKIKPRIDSTWEFCKGREAIKTLADRKNIGKVLLEVKKE